MIMCAATASHRARRARYKPPTPRFDPPSHCWARAAPRGRGSLVRSDRARCHVACSSPSTSAHPSQGCGREASACVPLTARTLRAYRVPPPTFPSHRQLRAVPCVLCAASGVSLQTEKRIFECLPRPRPADSCVHCTRQARCRPCSLAINNSQHHECCEPPAGPPDATCRPSSFRTCVRAARLRDAAEAAPRDPGATLGPYPEATYTRMILMVCLAVCEPRMFPYPPATGEQLPLMSSAA